LAQDRSTQSFVMRASLSGTVGFGGLSCYSSLLLLGRIRNGRFQ